MIQLKHISLFFPFVDDLSDTSKRELAENGTAYTHSRGDLLLAQGDRINGTYLISHGKLEVFTLSKEGREAVLYNVRGGGSCVFALNALFNDMVYPAWVRVASNELKLVNIEGTTFRRLFECEPAIRNWVWSVQSNRVIELMCTMEEYLQHSLEERLCLYLRRSMNTRGEVVQTHESIARNLKSSREVITRHLKKLANTGALSLKRGRILIHEASRL